MKIENIKFKAKRIDDNIWVEGYFYSECGNAYIIENGQKESKLNRNLTYKVDHSTVCQFTGLKDSDGKEIWDGDIVEFETYDLYKGIVERKAIIGYTGSGFFAIVDDIPYTLSSKCIKIVGNKFDKEK